MTLPLNSGNHLLPQLPRLSNTGLSSWPEGVNEYSTVNGLVLRTSRRTISLSSRNFKVADMVFEFIPDTRRSSLKRLGPVKRCLTISNLDSVTMFLIAPTTGHMSVATCKLCVLSLIRDDMFVRN